MFTMKTASKALREAAGSGATGWEPINSGTPVSLAPDEMIVARVEYSDGRTEDVPAGALREAI